MLVIDSVKEISGMDAENRGSLPGWQAEPRFLSTYCRLCHLNYLHILSEESPKYENTFAPIPSITQKAVSYTKNHRRNCGNHKKIPRTIARDCNLFDI